jgi:hypothetical protein
MVLARFGLLLTVPASSNYNNEDGLRVNVAVQSYSGQHKLIFCLKVVALFAVSKLVVQAKDLTASSVCPTG